MKYVIALLLAFFPLSASAEDVRYEFVRTTADGKRTTDKTVMHYDDEHGSYHGPVFGKMYLFSISQENDGSWKIVNDYGDGESRLVSRIAQMRGPFYHTQSGVRRTVIFEEESTYPGHDVLKFVGEVENDLLYMQEVEIIVKEKARSSVCGIRLDKRYRIITSVCRSAFSSTEMKRVD